jgi:YYY domain-containing protein
MSWWAISVAIGVIAFPISFYLFRKSYDKGYLFSKIIGLFLLGYVSWMIGFINFSTVSILCVTVAMIALSSYIFMMNKKEILDFLGEKLSMILIAELFYLLIFLVHAFWKMYHPDIEGQEKFMDFAFMNSIARGDKIPPLDPWMAGSNMHISYYYFGYVMMSFILKLTAIPPGMAYNVALTYLYAITAIGMLGLMYNLTKNYVAGFVGFAFLLVLGNLDGLRQLIHSSFNFGAFNWWNSTRIMDYDYDYTITEFPFFSYLIGDMHPHQMAVPFVLLSLNIALSFIKSEDKNLFEVKPEKLSFLIFAGLALGGLWFLNSWDFPTYFFVLALCVLSYKYSRDEKFDHWIKDAAISLGIIFGVAVIAYLPFTLAFKSQFKGIAPVFVNTKLSDYLLIFGIMLFPVVSFMTARVLNWVYALRLHGAGSKTKKRELFCPHCHTQFREGKLICGQCGYKINGDELYLGGMDVPVKKSNETAISFFKAIIDPASAKGTNTLMTAVITLAIAAVFIIYKTVVDKHNTGITTGFIFLLLSVVFLLGVTKTELKENQFAIILIFTALFATFGTELLRIVDLFNDSPKNQRMNTVFKFYYQAWIMLSVASAYAFYWINEFYLRFKQKWLKIVWNGALALLMFSGFLYTMAGTYVRTNNFGNVFTLDGSDFMHTFNYDNRLPAEGDKQAIDWINRSIKGSPVILEACGGSYSEYARISSFTGLPTVIGWPWHETQWRGDGTEASRRESDVREIYESTDINRAMQLLQQYNVRYIYMGVLEQDKYAKSPQGLAKFDAMYKQGLIEPVYANQFTSMIYKIK